MSEDKKETEQLRVEISSPPPLVSGKKDQRILYLKRV